MIVPGSAVYHVVEAMVPLYTAAALGYASVRWLRAFSEEQCAGINHFVALYAVPVLIFHMVSTNDPYHMNERLVAADTLQKAAVLLALTAWAFWSHFRARRGGKANKAKSPLKWVITSFSVASLPNTIIMGVPLLDGMYGAVSGGLMKQVVVMQFCVWYNVVIFLYEFMEARRAADGSGAARISPEEEEEKRVVHDDKNPPPADYQNQAVVVSIEITEMAAATPAPAPTGDGDGADAADVHTTAPPPELAEDTASSSSSDDAHAPSMKHVAWKAVKKLLLIPNTYASFLGLIWSLMAFKIGFSMPKIVDGSLSIIHTTAVGLSMFSSGTFIARQPRFVPCGYTIASLSMVLKFLVGPVVMLLASIALGMHGTLLHIAVVQAALPLAVTSFVYAEEYKVHADIMSTGVILGIFISLPVTIVYYILLGL